MSAIQDLEEKVMRQCIKDLLAAGLEVSVNDGEETVLRRSSDAETIFSKMRTTEEDYLIVFKSGQKERYGAVYFVYGNDGHDVICDQSVHLEEILSGTATLVREMGD